MALQARLSVFVVGEAWQWIRLGSYTYGAAGAARQSPMGRSTARSVAVDARREMEARLWLLLLRGSVPGSSPSCTIHPP
jgi:hypothetical protein